MYFVFYQITVGSWKYSNTFESVINFIKSYGEFLRFQPIYYVQVWDENNFKTNPKNEKKRPKNLTFKAVKVQIPSSIWRGFTQKMRKYDWKTTFLGMRGNETELKSWDSQTAHLEPLLNVHI